MPLLRLAAARTRHVQRRAILPTLLLTTSYAIMKRSHASFREGSYSNEGSDDDAFDDGDDLMARAASMMDFDDEISSEGGDENSEAGDSTAGSSEAGPSAGKKQKLSDGRLKGKKKEVLDVLPEDEEAEVQSVLQLQVCRAVIAATNSAKTDRELTTGISAVPLPYYGQIDALLGSVRCPDPSSSRGRQLTNFVERLR